MDARVVTSGPDLEEVRTLFREYAAWVAVDLSFQGFAEELARLPGEYVAPAGTLLVCTVEGSAAGCIAVRAWGEGVCEMKRLYVRPGYQGQGCGLFLAERAIAWATDAGYTRMVLDTLPTMSAAQRLYIRLHAVLATALLIPLPPTVAGHPPPGPAEGRDARASAVADTVRQLFRAAEEKRIDRGMT